MLKAKPTRYKDTQFKSRTEAKIAVCLDAWNWDWEYEPPIYHEDWQPDFLVRSPSRSMALLIEVKPCFPTGEYVHELQDHFGALIQCQGNQVAKFLKVETLVCELWCVNFFKKEVHGLRFIDLQVLKVINEELHERDFTHGNNYRFDLAHS